MKCSICGTETAPGTPRCPECGAPLRPLSPFDPEYVRPEKKKKTWLWILLATVTVLCLIIGVFTANIVNLVVRISDVDPEPVPESVPSQTLPTVTIPSEVTAEDCFVLAEGILRFLPERHDGSPIVHIPETIGGQTVTAIGPECFFGCDAITTIILPETVTAIHPRAFAGCTNLRGVFLPEGVTYIGADAFEGCIKLEAIHIPSTMDSIDGGVFDDCASLSFIFYSGNHDVWTTLYSDYITPYTYVICLDGDYFHGVN